MNIIQSKLEALIKFVDEQLSSPWQVALDTLAIALVIYFTIIQYTRWPIIAVYLNTAKIPFPLDIVTFTYWLYPIFEYMFFFVGILSMATFMFYLGRRLGSQYVDDSLTSIGIRARLEDMDEEDIVIKWDKILYPIEQLVATHKTSSEVK